MSTSGTRRSITSVFCIAVTAIAILLTAVPTVLSVPASPELLENLKATGQLQRFVDRMADARERGLWQPGPSIADTRDRAGQALSYSGITPDTFSVLVLLVDFSDNPASAGQVFAQKADFEHLLFSYDDNDNHYSMAEFYRDNSYGGFIMQGQVAGWFRAPQTYAYYVNGNNGFGSYPQNAQKLTEDVVLMADPVVDYAQFDADGNGNVDGVFIVHAGPGAEQTGNDNHIWSHAWSLHTPLFLDGVNITRYTAEPEENTSTGLSTMGVYAHEYGHFLGLPDLYDTDYSSSGCGDWSLMAGGSWNGGGRFPAFMDPWCKKEVGFLTLTNIESCMTDVAIPTSYYEPIAYRLWASGVAGPQYFIVENRRRIQKDNGIPGSGLLIYHIDETVGGNWDENHPLVAVEQADGLFQLQSGANGGDGGDPWSTLTKTEFDDLSTPNTRTYINEVTQVAVWGISGLDSVMHAGFDTYFCRPRFELLSGTFSDADFGNGNGYAEAGETLTFTFGLRNLWATSTNTTGTLVADNNDITFNAPASNIGTVNGFGGLGNNNANPITFTVPVNFVPCIDSFFLTVDADQSGGTRTYGFELHIGEPTVLLVDDDNNDTWNLTYEQLLFNMRVPFDVWEKSVSGSPSGATLSAYSTVVWMTGNTRADILSAVDVTAMESFLDGGGNLFLTGQTIIKELNTDDQTFLNDYLKTSYVADQLYPFMNGQAGTEIGDGYKIRYYTGTNQTNPQKMGTINGSVAEFVLPVGGVTMLSWAGSYKVVVASFGLEGIGDQFLSQGWATKDMVFQRIMGFFEPDTASQNPTVVTTGVTGAASVMRLTNHTPEFSWTFDDTTGAPVVEYEVQVGTGRLCYNWDNMWSPAVFTGSDTSVVYAGLPLVDGSSYVFRVRVNNGTHWSAWKEMDFHMNAVTIPGLLVSPLHDTLVTTSTPLLKVSNSTDPDGDVLTYGFEVYSDQQLTALVAQVAGVAQQSSHTTWTVGTPLPDDAQYWWRSRTFDGAEYSNYTGTGSFLVNGSNQAPLAFGLIAPVDKDTLLDSLPVFSWTASGDNDIADEVSYTMWLTMDSLFGTYQAISALDATTVGLDDALSTGYEYFWKVKAVDLQGAITWSTETYRFYLQPATCCLRRGDADRSGTISVGDITYLVNFLFKAGPAAVCAEEGDVNNSGGNANVSDLTYLVNYVFKGGAQPPPCL